MAKPIKGTDGSDFLFGTDGSDIIEAKAGDDVISGGKGNDDIDGGLGIDTAVYRGNYSDYVLSFKGTGNDKVTITDTVANRDGTDQLKHVEFATFNDAMVNLQTGETSQWQYFINAEVDEKGQKASTEDVINGNGNSATGYNLARNEDAGVELGFQVKYRQGPTVLATDPNGYADGVLHFQVNDGPQSTANGSFQNNANRAAWSFDYSIITGLNGAPTDLSDFTFKLRVDVDRTAAVDYQVFTMDAVGSGSANVHWINQYGDLVVDDNGIAGEVAQNSRNLAFYDVDHGTNGTQVYDPSFGAGRFDIVLEAYQGVQLVGINHIVVDVV